MNPTPYQLHQFLRDSTDELLSKMDTMDVASQRGHIEIQCNAWLFKLFPQLLESVYIEIDGEDEIPFVSNAALKMQGMHISYEECVPWDEHLGKLLRKQGSSLQEGRLEIREYPCVLPEPSSHRVFSSLLEKIICRQLEALKAQLAAEQLDSATLERPSGNRLGRL